MVQTRIDLTPAEWRQVKALAAADGKPVATFLALALARSPLTKKVFAQ